MIEDIISELIFAQYFEQMFKDLQKEMEGSFGEYGDQNIVDDLLRFTEAYQNSIGGYNEAMIAAQKAFAEQGFDLFSQTRSASAKGFASMSQNSADELNGRFTAIQGHTFSIVEGMKILQANSSQALKHLAGIETNTSRLEAVENNLVKVNNTMSSVKSGIDDINNKGVFIKG
ncbi:hypothetical protein SDC9_193406 [bioreactor metagenome]|uniref:Uncharacterized protein n=1 Tax=bioreactor metagenome TaxID=1076179 RepID=A0A645IEK5_9ZZZZ